MASIRQHSFTYKYFVRWVVSSLGLWISAGLLHGAIDYQHSVGVILVGGAILALLNAIIRPILIVISVPAILLSLGLFMFIINGVTVYLASKLYAPLDIMSFGAAVLTGLIISLVNYLVTAILETR